MLQHFRSPGWTRREVLGMGVAALALSGSASAATATFPKGAIIRTILKDYAPEDLAGAATLFHEHLSLADNFMTRWYGFGRLGVVTRQPGAAAAASAGPFFMQDLDLMTREMTIAKSEGISCIVDGGHPDMGRDTKFLRQLSMKSGMPMVAGGGFYAQPFYPKEISAMSEGQIVRALIKQTQVDPIGVFGEIGSWGDITADERKVFRAVGKASAATNLAIFTHTGIPGKSAMEQLDLLEDAGAKPNRIVIGHLGNLVDSNVAVQKAICKRGAFIGFDRQGGPGDETVVPMVMALIEAGFADNLMFSSISRSRTN